MQTDNRIFLAHASEDKAQVRSLYHELKRRGYAPWLDEIDLTPGADWTKEIPKAIKEAAVCLVCLSEQSVTKRSYVQKEIRYAFSAHAELPPNEIFLIPVRLNECEMPDIRNPDLGLSLSDIQWIDLWKDDGLERLISVLRNKLDLAFGVRSIKEMNSMYHDVMRKAARGLEGQRVRYKGRKGRIQSAYINPKLTRVDIVNDDGRLEVDVDLVPAISTNLM